MEVVRGVTTAVVTTAVVVMVVMVVTVGVTAMGVKGGVVVAAWAAAMGRLE